MRKRSSFNRLTLLAFLIGLLLTLGSFSVGTANAEGTGEEGSSNEEICKKLDGLGSRLVSKVEEKNTKLKSSRSERSGKFGVKRAGAEQTLTAKRAEWDKKRDEHFAVLMDKALTNEHKEAVVAYQRAIIDAVAARRSAYDTARLNFQKSVDGALAVRKATVDGQVATLKNGMQTAVNTAVANCPSQGKAALVKLQADIKALRESYKNSRKNDSALKVQIKQYQAARKTATDAADTAFRAGIAKAKADFRTALLTKTVP